MTELIIGVAIGAAGMYAKDKFFGGSSEKISNTKKQELDDLYAENEKFRKRNKDLTREIENLKLENERLYKQVNNKEDAQFKVEDDLQKAKNEVKKLRLQNDELYNKLQEYKSACESYQFEISRLKQNQ